MQTTLFMVLQLSTFFFLIKARKGIRGAIKELSGKSSDFELFFFSRYFLVFFTRFMSLFMAGHTHSLLFSNILLMHHQSSTDAIRRRKKLSGKPKLQALQSFLCFSPIHDTFFQLCMFFCVKFIGKMMCLRKCWCFLQG